MDTPKIVVVPTAVATTLPIFICSLSSFHAHLDQAGEAIADLRLSHPESTPSNVRSTYMSPWKSHHLNTKLRHLCDSVVKIAKFSSATFLSSSLEALNMDLTVSDCWGAVYDEGGHAERHNHFPADFGCVIYLEADAHCAPIIFAENVTIQPEPGMMILFPGILDHEVPKTTGRRVVVSMNLLKCAPASPAFI